MFLSFPPVLEPAFLSVVMAVIHIQVGVGMDHNVQLVFGLSGSLICYKQIPK